LEFLVHNWGNLASVLGVMVSVVTLAVATKARQAAEAAKAVARRQSLTEVLQDTVRKNEQVGLFLSQRRWDIV
jgi:predicted ATPase